MKKTQYEIILNVEGKSPAIIQYEVNTDTEGTEHDRIMVSVLRDKGVRQFLDLINSVFKGKSSIVFEKGKE